MPASKRKRDSLIRSVVNGPASGTHVVSLDPYPINERILTRRAELLHSRQKQMEQLMQEHEELVIISSLTLRSYSTASDLIDT